MIQAARLNIPKFALDFESRKEQTRGYYPLQQRESYERVQERVTSLIGLDLKMVSWPL